MLAAFTRSLYLYRIETTYPLASIKFGCACGYKCLSAHLHSSSYTNIDIRSNARYVSDIEESQQEHRDRTQEMAKDSIAVRKGEDKGAGKVSGTRAQENRVYWPGDHVPQPSYRRYLSVMAVVRVHSIIR